MPSKRKQIGKESERGEQVERKSQLTFTKVLYKKNNLLQQENYI